VFAIRRFGEPHVLFEHRHVDDHGIKVIPAPGHTPGSTWFLVPGADAATYLFTGDTVFLADNGVWTPANTATNEQHALRHRFRRRMLGAWLRK
jgi:glyoxylase-like metal-dependent hydrolase (beta-lactamase superfamily II)